MKLRIHRHVYAVDADTTVICAATILFGLEEADISPPSCYKYLVERDTRVYYGNNNYIKELVFQELDEQKVLALLYQEAYNEDKGQQLFDKLIDHDLQEYSS